MGSDISAVAAPVGAVFTNWAQANPAATAALAGAVLSFLADALTSRVRILSDRPWLVDLIRAGVGVATRSVQANLEKGDKK